MGNYRKPVELMVLASHRSVTSDEWHAGEVRCIEPLVTHSAPGDLPP